MVMRFFAYPPPDIYRDCEFAQKGSCLVHPNILTCCYSERSEVSQRIFRTVSKKLLLFVLLLFVFLSSIGQTIVLEKNTLLKTTDDFILCSPNSVADILLDSADSKTVLLAAGLFSDDVERVTGQKPVIKYNARSASGNCVIAGSIEGCGFIRELVRKKIINISEVKGKWEACLIQCVENPVKGINKSLVIAGSDRRGTAFGLLELSRQMGVSPWYYFADVPPVKREEIIIKKGTLIQKSPSVQYRGIFINDEMWGIRPWDQEYPGELWNYVANRELITVGGKWDRMASLPGPWGNQWRQWDMPPVSYYSGEGNSELYLSMEGGGKDILPGFSVFNSDKHYIDLFNAGNGVVYWEAEASANWIKLNEMAGVISDEKRIWITVDAEKAPKGNNMQGQVVFKWNTSEDEEWRSWENLSETDREAYKKVTLSYSSPGKNRAVRVILFNPVEPSVEKIKGFAESNGCISMEAEHFSRKNDANRACWSILEGLGRTGNSVTTLPFNLPGFKTVDEILSGSPGIGLL